MTPQGNVSCRLGCLWWGCYRHSAHEVGCWHCTFLPLPVHLFQTALTIALRSNYGAMNVNIAKFVVLPRYAQEIVLWVPEQRRLCLPGLGDLHEDMAKYQEYASDFEGEYIQWRVHTPSQGTPLVEHVVSDTHDILPRREFGSGRNDKPVCNCKASHRLLTNI